MSRRAIVTGVTGQTGTYLAQVLLTQGWEVHGLGRRRSGMLPTVPLHDVDLRDHVVVARLVRDLRPSAIINLAAISSVAQSWREPVVTNEVNALAVANLLELVRELGDEGRPVRFVQASSAEIFGAATESPQTESTPLAPTNPYGVAKASAHMLTQAYRTSGLHCSNAILYNHESVLRPETFVTRKITRTAARIATGQETELVLGDIGIARDWGWAGDYARAVSALLALDVPGDYVVATGVSHTIRDLVTIAFEAAGIPDWPRFVRTDTALNRPTETARMLGDASKLRRATGWRPTVTFEQMIAEMVRHDLAEATA